MIIIEEKLVLNVIHNYLECMDRKRGNILINLREKERVQAE